MSSYSKLHRSFTIELRFALVLERVYMNVSVHCYIDLPSKGRLMASNQTNSGLFLGFRRHFFQKGIVGVAENGILNVEC